MTWLDPKGGGGGLIQNSPEWYQWRMHHIGASDVPSIMGTSDFGNAHGVFIAKTQGALDNPSDNYATQRGKSLEPVIISKFEEAYNLRTTQPSLEYKEWPVLSASLDGWVDQERIIVEVKAPARIKHIQALCGAVPKTYIDQVQTQLLVAEGKINYYVSYSPDEPDGFNFAVVEVDPDKKRQEQILKACHMFWLMVESKVWDENFPKFVQEISEEPACRLFSNLEKAVPGLRPDPPRRRNTQPRPSELKTSFASELE